MYEGKTREDLYLMLKDRFPDLALGRSRARREELELLLTSSLAAQPAQPKPAPKRRAPKPRAAVINLPVPQAAIEKTRRGLEMLELAANAIEMSGMSPTQIGTLLYIHLGLDAEQAGQAVHGLIGLRAALLGEKAA